VSGGAPAGPTDRATRGAMTSVFGRRERFAEVGSTNDVVRAWLADGEPEVCVAVADRQSAGRGRGGRTWVAPDGAALLLSLGFRPTWLAPDRTWRLAAIAALAMAAAAESVADLPAGSIRLKWPNDLVVEEGSRADPRAGIARKLAGVLGETDGLGTNEPHATIGIGVNVAWPASAFPSDLAGAMTSLDEIGGGRAIDRTALLDAFLARLEPALLTLRDGDFDAAGWTDRQLTTGRTVRLEHLDGSTEDAMAVGVDPVSGALLVVDGHVLGGRRTVLSGEITHVRVRPTTTPARAGV
jgi:BirA family transcriptional regulator, biotin operon repressor / biotin---[acetyl-CoA-carboxylase] ligase